MGCQQSVLAALPEDTFPPVKESASYNFAPPSSTKSDATAATSSRSETSVSSRFSKLGPDQCQEPRTAEELLPPKLDGNGRLMPEEVVRRTTSSLTNTSVLLGNKQRDGGVVTIEYAHWTQRGYYPDDPHKQNQDEHGIHLNFAGEEGDALFAIYDGHGDDGHACAQYAKKKLPVLIGKHLRRARAKKYQLERASRGDTSKKGAWNPKQWPLLSREEYESCCSKAFVECNNDMRKDESVPDLKSGTTAATVGFHGTRVTVSNVGDSRVIIGHGMPKRGGSYYEETKEEEKMEIEPIEYGGARANKHNDCFSFDKESYMAIPLSRDHTPFRKDERERVIAFGAEVMSVDQKEEDRHDNWGDMVLGDDIDIHGDPPRVWSKGNSYPGCALTRSLGDSIAKDIGVVAEPEIISCDLTENDQIMVLASDGIFEFLSNQAVIDMCTGCESPLHACEKVVKAAYKKWLMYENRSDDITIIVIFLKCTKPIPNDITGTTEELVDTAKLFYGEKPVREFSRGSNNNLCICRQLASSYDTDGDIPEALLVSPTRHEFDYGNSLCVPQNHEYATEEMKADYDE